jgi:hypothetical protein
MISQQDFKNYSKKKKRKKEEEEILDLMLAPIFDRRVTMRSMTLEKYCCCNN